LSPWCRERAGQVPLPVGFRVNTLMLIERTFKRRTAMSEVP